MTGIIVNLSGDRLSGTIMGEDGVPVRFESDAVLAHDAIRLEAGKAVNFEISTHHRTRAVNVSVRAIPTANLRDGRTPAQPLRYMGFEQKAGVREYHFQRTLPGEMSVGYIVTSEVALFTRHRVALQEGPALCLLRLNSELERVGADPTRVNHCCLGEREMLEYLSSRPVPTKHHSHRPGPARTAAAQA